MTRVALGFILLLISGVTPLPASWFYGPPHVKDLDFFGVFSPTIPLGNAAGENGDDITLYLSHRFSEDPTCPGSELYVTGLETALTPTRHGWRWRSPNGILADSNESPTSEPSICRIIGQSDERACVVTRDGWSLIYAWGNLVRAISPQGRMYRIQTNGPFIKRISVLSAGTEKTLLQVEFNPVNRPNKLYLNGTNFTFDYDGGGRLTRVLKDGASWLGFSYERAVLREIVGDQQFAGALQWRSINPVNFLMQRINPYGYVLQSFRDTAYTIKATQATVQVIAESSGSRLEGIYNLYSNSMTSYHEQKIR